MSGEDRARQVAESSCTNPDCGMCRDYIATGNPDLRPSTWDEYYATSGQRAKS